MKGSEFKDGFIRGVRVHSRFTFGGRAAPDARERVPSVPDMGLN